MEGKERLGGVFFMIMYMSGKRELSSAPCGIAGFGSDKTGAATMLFFLIDL